MTPSTVLENCRPPIAQREEKFRAANGPDLIQIAATEGANARATNASRPTSKRWSRRRGKRFKRGGVKKGSSPDIANRPALAQAMQRP
jgi:hypothetical protein